jgi:hypothetical protein
MTRVVHRGVYVSDIIPGTAFSRRVDDHFYTQAVLGWAALAGGEIPLPSTVRPRHAVGVDATGRRHSVVIASPTADIWTRASSDWLILDDAGATDSVLVTGLVGEAVTF